MDLDFIDCVSYPLCDSGALGLDCGNLIFQWHTPFGWLVLGNKKPPMLFMQQRRSGLWVCYWAMANGAFFVCGFAVLALAVLVLAVLS